MDDWVAQAHMRGTQSERNREKEREKRTGLTRTRAMGLHRQCAAADGCHAGGVCSHLQTLHEEIGAGGNRYLGHSQLLPSH